MSTEPKISFPDQMIEQHGDLHQAIEWTRQQVQKSPIDQRLNLQVLLNLVGEEQQSFAVSDELMTIASDDARVLFNRGWHLLHRGEFAKGFALLEHGRTFGSYGDQKPYSQGPWFNLEGPKVKHMIMVLEGGMGDQIIHARFAKQIAEHLGHPITLACHPSLCSIFSRMDWVHSVVTREAAAGMYHEQWLPGMSAPGVLHKSFDEISGKPYLTTHEAATVHWKKVINQFNTNKKLKVGIRWAGAPHFEHQQMRKFPHDVLTDFKNINSIQLFSFQRDNDLVDLPEQIVDLGPFLKSWEDTAAALKEMDVVVSSCTSVAHMAAALGVKTWVVTPVLPYFVWATPGEKSPWYDSVTLYRQQKFSEWSDVSERIRMDLQKLSQ